MKESFKSLEVVGVERHTAYRTDFGGSCLEPLGVASGQNDVGALDARPAGGLEPDAGASTNDDDGLPG